MIPLCESTKKQRVSHCQASRGEPAHMRWEMEGDASTNLLVGFVAPPKTKLSAILLEQDPRFDYR
jgi:hypothetical protein